MKTKICTLCFFALLFSSTLFATIRRVGYTDVPAVTNVDYTSFYLAYQAAVNGDTIYVFPGKTISQSGWPTANGRAEINKRLVIVGKGSWLDSSSNPRGNTDFQATKGIATFGNSRTDIYGAIFFYSGGAGSTIMGFDGQGQMIVVSSSNITIKSNFNLTIYLSSDIAINSNLTVEKNYRLSFSGDDNKNISFNNFTIRNNFFYQFNLPDKSFSGRIANNTFANDYNGTANGGDLAMSYVDANTFYFYFSNINLRDGSWIFENNLIVFRQAVTPFATPFVITGGNLSYLNYNVAIQSTNFTSWPGNATGNIFLAPSVIANIFEGFPAIGTRSADDRYMLKANSPANQANRPGSIADAGMFGGTTPYKLSTIPSIPTIYKISSPQGNNPTGSTIDIKISTRSNN